MIRTAVKPAIGLAGALAVVLAAWLAGSSAAVAQPPAGGEQAKPTNPKLEEMLAKVLKDNPDIRVAEAKVREAEAELNRIRLQIVQKAVTLYHSLESQKSAVEATRAQSDEAAQLAATGRIPPGDHLRLRATLSSEKAKLAALEAELPYLLGNQPQGAVPRIYLNAVELERVAQQGLPSNLSAHKTAGQPLSKAMAEKIRAALDTPIPVDFKDKPLLDILKEIQRVHGIPFVFVVKTYDITLQFDQPVPLGLVLQAIGDIHPAIRFVVRDYGILVTELAVPPGAISVHDFWKSHPDKEKSKPSNTGEGGGTAPTRNPPPEEVHGRVKAVDRSTGLVTITIGSDQGLGPGHTLEIFRTEPQPKYLGVLQILSVRPTEAIGRPLGRTTSPIQAQDRVASAGAMSEE